MVHKKSLAKRKTLKKKVLRRDRHRNTRRRTVAKKKQDGGFIFRESRGSKKIFRSADSKKINNYKIPGELILKHIFMHLLFGRNGKLCALPLPGQIFKLSGNTNIEDAYVCIQSCIGELKTSLEYNLTQSIISQGGGVCGDDEIYQKAIDYSLIERAIRNKNSINDKIYQAYKKLSGISFTKNGFFGKNEKSLYDLYEEIIVLFDSVIGNTEFTGANIDLGGYGREKIIYGIPLIKREGESPKIKAFSLNQVSSSFKTDNQEQIKDDLITLLGNSVIDYSQEDYMYHRYGVLDLTDSLRFDEEKPDEDNILQRGFKNFMDFGEKFTKKKDSIEDIEKKIQQMSDGEGENKEEEIEKLKKELDEAEKETEEKAKKDSEEENKRDPVKNKLNEIIKKFNELEKKMKDDLKPYTNITKFGEVIKYCDENMNEYDNLSKFANEIQTMIEDIINSDIKGNRELLNLYEELFNKIKTNILKYTRKINKLKKILEDKKNVSEKVRDILKKYSDLSFSEKERNPKRSEKCGKIMGIIANLLSYQSEKDLFITFKDNGNFIEINKKVKFTKKDGKLKQFQADSGFSEDFFTRGNPVESTTDKKSNNEEQEFDKILIWKNPGNDRGVNNRLVLLGQGKFFYPIFERGKSLCEKSINLNIIDSEGIKEIEDEMNEEKHKESMMEIISENITSLKEKCGDKCSDDTEGEVEPDAEVVDRESAADAEVGSKGEVGSDAEVVDRESAADAEVESDGEVEPDAEVVDRKSAKGGAIKRTRKKTLRKRGGGRTTEGVQYIKDLGLGWLKAGKKQRESRFFDLYLQDHNWNSRIGDTFLWVGNSLQYTGSHVSNGIRRKYTDTMEDAEYRKRTYYDTNTLNRLPDYGSYCTIIGYGVDVLYKTDGGDSVDEGESADENSYKNYKNMYKNGNLLCGGGDQRKIYPDGERITSRLIRTNDGKYRWAFSKDEKRELTPSKCCYYIIESKKQSITQSRYCKVYVDELYYWGFNYIRFTTNLQGAMKLKNGIDPTTQGIIEREFNTREDVFCADQINIGDNNYGDYEIAKSLNKLDFLRFLPANLYSYLAYLFIDVCNKDIDSFKEALISMNWKPKNSRNEKSEILFRYPKSITYAQQMEEYHVKKEDIKSILENLSKLTEKRDYRLTHSSLNDINNFDDFSSPTSDKYETIFDEYVNKFIPGYKTYNYKSSGNFFRYNCIKTESIKDKEDLSWNENTVYKFFPKSINPNDVEKRKEELENWLKDIYKGGSTSVDDFKKYGIDIKGWLDENRKSSNKFIKTDAVTYMAIPSLLEISSVIASNDTENKPEIYSLGYYMFINKRSYDTKENTSPKLNQALYWHDRHLLETERGRITHAPLIFISNKGDKGGREIHIPPLFFNITDEDVKTLKENIEELNKVNKKSWKLVEWQDDNISLSAGKHMKEVIEITRKQYYTSHKEFKDPKKCCDIRKYCNDYIRGITSGKTIYYVKGENLLNTSSESGALSDNFIILGDKSYQQYSSVKKILPISQRVIAFQENQMDDKLTFTATGGEDFHSSRYIFEGLETERLNSNQNISLYFFGSSNYIFSDCKGTDFYDFYHLTNVAKYMTNVAATIGYSLIATPKKWYNKATGRILEPGKIALLGRFCESSRKRKTLFFSDDTPEYPGDGIMFFKYLFYKFKVDLNIFNEFTVKDKDSKSEKTHLATCNKRNDKTFRRWGKEIYQSIPLILNPSMICRIGQIQNPQKCFKITESDKDPTLSIKDKYNYGAEALTMQSVDTMLNEYLTIIDEFFKTDQFTGIQVDFGVLKTGLLGAAGMATGGITGAVGATLAPPPPQPQQPYSGGGSKRTNKKIKRTGKKIKRTGKKIKRTGKKIKRTGKKIRRTNKKRKNKKRVYNP